MKSEMAPSCPLVWQCSRPTLLLGCFLRPARLELQSLGPLLDGVLKFLQLDLPTGRPRAMDVPGLPPAAAWLGHWRAHLSCAVGLQPT